MFGYQVIEMGKQTRFKIASPEKAILDYLYWNPEIETSEDIAALRWNQEQLQNLETSSLFRRYIKIFNNKILQHRVEVMMEYAHA